MEAIKLSKPEEKLRHLFLAEVQFDAAGVFSCWEGSFKTKTTNLIVLSSDNNCFAIPESSDNENIFLRHNDSITILCTFQYSADESCIVTPIWTDLTGYRNFTIPGDDFEVNMDEKHAWISFRCGADVKNGTRFDLSFVFDCSSFSNYNQGQQGMHYFGMVPFILIMEHKTGNINKDENNKRGAFVIALLAGTITPLTAITAVLLLLGIKTFYSAKSQKQIVGNKKIMAKTIESEISLYSEIKENIISEEIRRFGALNDNLYEVINDSSETKACENYITIGFVKSLL